MIISLYLRNPVAHRFARLLLYKEVHMRVVLSCLAFRATNESIVDPCIFDTADAMSKTPARIADQSLRSPGMIYFRV